MPLKRAQWGAPYEETKSVCFPMVDTDTGEQISCEVSFACLLPAPGQAKDLLAEFEMTTVEDRHLGDPATLFRERGDPGDVGRDGRVEQGLLDLEEPLIVRP